MAGQSSDRMISTCKNRRKAAHLSCRLKYIFLKNNSNENATEIF